MMDDPMSQPAAEPTFDPEMQRKKVALALSMQGKMNKHPWGQAANQMLQVWNMKRDIPKPITASTMPPPADPMAGGYPTEIVGGG